MAHALAFPLSELHVSVDLDDTLHGDLLAPLPADAERAELALEPLLRPRRDRLILPVPVGGRGGHRGGDRACHHACLLGAVIQVN